MFTDRQWIAIRVPPSSNLGSKFAALQAPLIKGFGLTWDQTFVFFEEAPNWEDRQMGKKEQRTKNKEQRIWWTTVWSRLGSDGIWRMFLSNVLVIFLPENIWCAFFLSPRLAFWIYRKTLLVVLETLLSSTYKCVILLLWIAEGSRSRTGKAMVPKSGLLSLVVNSVTEGKFSNCPPVVISQKSQVTRKC